jgi:hypothetical protein
VPALPLPERFRLHPDLLPGRYARSRIHRVQYSRVDHGVAPIERALHGHRVEHVPNQYLRGLNPDRSERGLYPLRTARRWRGSGHMSGRRCICLPLRTSFK